MKNNIIVGLTAAAMCMSVTGCSSINKAELKKFLQEKIKAKTTQTKTLQKVSGTTENTQKKIEELNEIIDSLEFELINENFIRDELYSELEQYEFNQCLYGPPEYFKPPITPESDTEKQTETPAQEQNTEAPQNQEQPQQQEQNTEQPAQQENPEQQQPAQQENQEQPQQQEQNTEQPQQQEQNTEQPAQEQNTEGQQEQNTEKQENPENNNNQNNQV